MGKPLVTCVIVSWKENPPGRIVRVMKDQTYPEKDILVVDLPNKKDWGHSKRALGLELANGKYVCFCNADDTYDPHFLEIMVGALEQEKADFIYCDFYDKSIKGKDWCAARLAIGGMTSGNFVVRTDKAKKVGWKHRVYAADWYFIRDLIKEGIQVLYVNMPLMTHN